MLICSSHAQSKVEAKTHPHLMVEIGYAKTPPEIDGNVADWPATGWIWFAPDIGFVTTELHDDGPTEPKGTALSYRDLSGWFALQWDEEWLYLSVRATDNVHDIDGGTVSQWWMKDGVTLLLDIPLDGDGTTWIAGDHAFSFTADDTYPDSASWWRDGTFEGRLAPPETQLAVQLGEEGNYTLEAAIPMGTIIKPTPHDGQTIGFLFLATDPDRGEEHWGGQLIYG